MICHFRKTKAAIFSVILLLFCAISTRRLYMGYVYQYINEIHVLFWLQISYIVIVGRYELS